MANEKRLIDINEAKKKLRAVKEWFDGYPCTKQDRLAQAVAKMCIEEIDKIKPVDAVEVVHGRWIRRHNETKCSQCQFIYYSCRADYNYCPNCGAKMDGGNKNG